MSDGKAVPEPELVLYGKLANFDDLKKASEIIIQAQYQKRMGAMRTRVRKFNKPGERPSYEFTVKIGEGGDIQEHTSVTTETMFVAYRDWAPGGGMVKDRYVFPFTIEGFNDPEGKPYELKWEVDVFPNGDGKYHDWVKIDLEFPVTKDGGVVVPKELPAIPVEFIKVINGSSKDPVDRETITALYENFFLTK